MEPLHLLMVLEPVYICIFDLLDGVPKLMHVYIRYGYCKNLKKTVKIIQTRTRERKSTQRAGRKLSKVKNGQLKSTFANSRDKVHLGRVYTSPITLIGGDPRKNDTVDMKEAQGNKAYTLEVLTKEAQPVTIMDCHAGNPCELEIDLMAKSSSPIIEGMYGQDWKERAET
ncbi:hypothetical protein Tco_1498875 [Tanacetum coccineum]